MTKEEKIKEAYGEHWEGFNLTAKRCALSHFGFIGNILEHPPKNIELEHKMGAFRPKSLEGIEYNNGWIRIESEGQYDELENGEYEWFNIENGKYDKGDLWAYGVFTHYKIVPIIKSNPPLF